jgi:CelD/BcsL family acetyltransferase involved in cellulose biosynthesis
MQPVYSEDRWLEHRFVTSTEDLDDLKPAWEALVQRRPDGDVFCTHAWLDAWRKTFSDYGTVGAMTLRHGSDVVGVMPLMLNAVRRGPALSVRFDYCPADEKYLLVPPRYRFIPVRQISPPINLESSNLRGTLLTAPGWEAECTRALFAGLRDTPGWNFGLFPCAEGDIATWREAAQDAGLRVYVRHGRRALVMADQLVAWDKYMEMRSRKFRQNMRYTEERAKAFEGGIRCQHFYGADQAEQGLQALYALAQCSWKVTGRDDGLDFRPMFTEATQKFFQHLCLTPSSEFAPYIQIHFSGERPVAGILCFVRGQRLSTWLKYYDPAITHVSPGRLLYKEVFTWAWNNGITSVDFNGSSPFVQYLSNRSVNYHQLLVFPKRPYAQLLHTLSRRLCPDVISGDFLPAQPGMNPPALTQGSNDHPS